MSDGVSEREKTSLQRAGRPVDFIKAGFMTSLGVVLLALLSLIVWHVSRATLEIIAPFVFGTVFALLLDPIVDRIERMHIRRGLAVFAVFSVFVMILIAIGIYGVPTLVTQVSNLVEQGPKYIAQLQKTADQFLHQHPRLLGFKLPSNTNALLGQFTGRSSDILRTSGGQVTTILLGSVTTLFDIIITLIITFYLLMDIDRLRARLIYLLPERARAPMSQYSRDIGGVFAEYLRGLMIVSALYGLVTMLIFFGMSLVHHSMANYALLIGVVGGILYTIPYIGPLVTAVITFLIAFAAGDVSFGLVGVGLTLLLNQVFDNVLVPRIIGGGVGLHPVASIFALTLGGAMFGLWGLLLSVPVAASIQVILFRLYPRLTTPTPPAFLRAQGVPLDEPKSARVFEGDAPRLPDKTTAAEETKHFEKPANTPPNELEKSQPETE